MDFKQWWKEVNSLVLARIGVTADDMPDLCFVRDWYDDGMEPEEAAEELLDTWAEEGDIPYDLISEEMDGDHESGLASAGFGTDEDYGLYSDEEF